MSETFEKYLSQSDIRVPIRRALLSVSDKTGVVDLARGLAESGCELIATGGTRAELLAAGLRVVDITEVTGEPEAFGGRMKTLSYPVGAALLFDRERDAEEAARRGIRGIDLVVCNLYPFARHAKAGASLDVLIENIDIGGPTMIRAAAKNFRHVAVLTDPADYPSFLAEVRDGAVSLATRAALMRKAFSHTADYDALVSATLATRAGEQEMRFRFANGRTLRYGENGHQRGVFYRDAAAETSLHDMEILGGKELSYNNIVDIYCAAESVRDLPAGACAVVKHGNPCGLAVAASPGEALQLAWEGDVVSAFGSIIAFRDEIGVEDLRWLGLDGPDRRFVEVVVAPAYTEDALSYLRLAKNLRIVRWRAEDMRWSSELRFVGGSVLVQSADDRLRDGLTVVSDCGHHPDDALVQFGLVAVRQIRSNAIALVRRTRRGGFQLLGMGAGQPNRAVSVRLAVDKARENLLRECPAGADPAAFVRTGLEQCLLVSDAFFPFPDGIEACAEAGVVCVVQPGGSVRDDAVIARARELGVTMALTGVRHFKH